MIRPHRLVLEMLDGLDWHDVTDDVDVETVRRGERMEPVAVLGAQGPRERAYLMLLWPNGHREMWTQRGGRPWDGVRVGAGQLKVLWDRARVRIRRAS